jgi:hypothetical protein
MGKLITISHRFEAGRFVFYNFKPVSEISWLFELFRASVAIPASRSEAKKLAITSSQGFFVIFQVKISI